MSDFRSGGPGEIPLTSHRPPKKIHSQIHRGLPRGSSQGGLGGFERVVFAGGPRTQQKDQNKKKKDQQKKKKKKKNSKTRHVQTQAP